MDKEQIYNNTIESFETLKYIFEVKFGDDVKNISYDIEPHTNDNEGLIEMGGEMIIDVNYTDPDLTIIASKLRKVDIILNEVFNSYYFTDEGKLVKHKAPSVLMSVGHMVYDLKLDYTNESIRIILGLTLFDV
jgi:hypothetical protein